MKIPQKWWVEPVIVQTYLGTNANGPNLAAEQNVFGNIQSATKLVIKADGVEVNSEMTLRFPPSADGIFTPQSLVTVQGRAAIVLVVKPHAVRGQLVYIEVATT